MMIIMIDIISIVFNVISVIAELFNNRKNLVKATAHFKYMKAILKHRTFRTKYLIQKI